MFAFKGKATCPRCGTPLLRSLLEYSGLAFLT
jgi:hypothetical protein